MTFNQKLYVCSRKLFCVLLTIILRIGIHYIEIDHIFRVTSLVLRYNYFNFVCNCLVLMKTHLQNGKNCGKLVGFKEDKNIFDYLKPAESLRFLTLCKHSFSVGIWKTKLTYKLLFITIRVILLITKLNSGHFYNFLFFFVTYEWTL
jgi:hypothetical protein